MNPDVYQRLNDTESDFTDGKQALTIQREERRPKTIPEEKEKQAFCLHLFNELKSTIRMEDWVSSYLGVLGSLIIIIIYAIDPDMGEITMKKWSDNPIDTFKTGSNGTYWIIFIIIFAIFVMWLSAYLLKKNFSFRGMIAITIVSLISKILGNQTHLADSGVNASVWALIFGFVLANTVFWSYLELPKWIGCIQKYQEYYIKLGLVCLAIDFSSLINLGYRGIVVGWVDTIIIFVIGYKFGNMLKIDKKVSIIMSGATTICGSSAANAIESAIGEKKISSLPIAIMSVFTIPSIPIPPLIANYLELDPQFAGAWIGGFVDTTGAVVASASIIKDHSGKQEAIKNASMVKMIQNILIGPIALMAILMIHGRKTLRLFVLWERLPKFVLGFLCTMAMFSIYSSTVNNNDKVYTGLFFLSEWYNILGFVAIGLDLNLKVVKNKIKDAGPALIFQYIFVQILDIFTTLGWSYLMFETLKP